MPDNVARSLALARTRGATITVATSTSSASEKAGADYILTGVNDQTMLGTAATVAVGGLLQILSGAVNLTSWAISNCIVKGLGSGATTINITTPGGGVTVSTGGKLIGVTIAVCNSFSGTALTVGGTNVNFNGVHNIYDDIVLTWTNSTAYTGYGLQINATNTGTTQSYIQMCNFGSISINGFASPVLVSTTVATSYDAWINGNSFESIACLTGGTGAMVQFVANGNAQIVGNNIGSLQFQPIGSTTSGVVFSGFQCCNNSINGFFPWDWNMTNSGSGGAPEFQQIAGAYGNTAQGVFPTLGNNLGTSVAWSGMAGLNSVGYTRCLGSHFDGTANSIMACGAAESSDTAFWMHLRFRLDVAFQSSSATQFLLSKSSGGKYIHVYLMNGDGQLHFEMNNSTYVEVQSGTGLAYWIPGVWYDVIVYWTGTTMGMIINNAPAITNASTNGMPTAGTLYIGNDVPPAATGLVGVISNVSIGNANLTAAQMAQLTMGDIPLTATEIYLMDEGTGTACTNKGSSGSTYNGSLGTTNKWVFGQ
jgi:hypothetical protein